MPVTVPGSSLDCSTIPVLFAATASPGRQQIMAQMLESLPSVWETQLEAGLLASA